MSPHPAPLWLWVHPCAMACGLLLALALLGHAARNCARAATDVKPPSVGGHIAWCLLLSLGALAAWELTRRFGLEPDVETQLSGAAADLRDRLRLHRQMGVTTAFFSAAALGLAVLVRTTDHKVTRTAHLLALSAGVLLSAGLQAVDGVAVLSALTRVVPAFVIPFSSSP